MRLLYPELFEKNRFLVHKVFTPFKFSRGRTFDFRGKYPKTKMCGFTSSKKIGLKNQNRINSFWFMSKKPLKNTVFSRLDHFSRPVRGVHFWDLVQTKYAVFQGTYFSSIFIDATLTFPIFSKLECTLLHIHKTCLFANC